MSAAYAEEGHVVTIGGFGPKPVRAKFIRGLRRARVEEQLREALKPWGLPLHRYRFVLERSQTPTYQDHHGIWQGWGDDISLQAAFIHRTTGARITVTQIWDDGEGRILQWGTQYGEMTL